MKGSFYNPGLLERTHFVTHVDKNKRNKSDIINTLAFIITEQIL